MTTKIKSVYLPLALLIILFVSLALFGTSFAFPRAINVQGRLTNSDNSPMIGNTDHTVDLDITINSSLSSWRTLMPNVPLDNGIFNIILENSASGAPLPEFTDNAPYTMQISVGSIRFPSQPIVSVPFAITARNVRDGMVVVSSEGIPIRGDYTGVSALAAGVVGTTIATQGAGVTGSAPRGFGVSGSGQVGIRGTATGLARTLITGVGVKGQQNNGTYNVMPGMTHVGGYATSVGGVAGNNNGGYPGISGYSKIGFGVYGTSLNDTSTATLAAGVYGESSGGKGVAGYAPNGIGVYGPTIEGQSNIGTGVYGHSNADWSTYSPLGALSWVGVRGYVVNDNAGVYGSSESGSGILGECASGDAVVGIGHVSGFSGVYGEYDVDVVTATGEGAAVMGRSLHAHGGPAVQGFSESSVAPGVYGYAERNHGVFGRSEASGEAGVKGTGLGPNSSGGYFTGGGSDGTALKIGTGKIRIRKGWWYYGSSPITMNSPTGKIVFTAAEGTKDLYINNNFVTVGSKIFFSVSGAVLPSDIIETHELHRIRFQKLLTTGRGGLSFIDFLVIN